MIFSLAATATQQGEINLRLLHQNKHLSPAATLLRTGGAQPEASSSKQTLEDQTATTSSGVFSNQDSLNKIVTDSAILSAIDTLKTIGIIPSSFNISGLNPADSNITTATDSTSVSVRRTESSTHTTTDSPIDSSSGNEAEGSEDPNNKSKKRNNPSDLEESELAPKRKKTE